MGWIEDHHAEWLSLVETSGPFLTVPALKRALPEGLGALPRLDDLRVAYAEWTADPSLQQRWVRWVLDELLGLAHARSESDGPTHRVPEHSETLRASYVVRDQTQDGDPAVLLVHRVAPDTALDRPLEGHAWAASPLDRAVELARASGVPLALVTDGRRWTLLWAREGETTGTCTWRSDLWLEEPITLRAFVELLGARRFFTVPIEQGLAKLLAESASKQQEVADQLGAQVRRATELLIATLDREDRDRHGTLLEALDSAEVYRGATTVMMRLVFLFVAEERRLLPIDDERYAATLAASTLRAQLQERADRDGEDVLERSHAAWHRLLALFRAVHGGVEHDALRLPAYGGGLFDPDRYPFLEGRETGTGWRTDTAAPLPVDDRTMLHILDQLQTLEQGGARVLLSYAALDVEQIGHVYEGLLDHTAVRITDTGLGLEGKLEPELALGELESWAEAGTLVARLAKETGRSAKAIEKLLDAEADDETLARLRAACLNDDAVSERVKPYHALLRVDLRGDPLVFPAGSLYVTQAIDRRASGTYYTPRALAEEVVQHALDPVAYSPGPAQVADKDQWRLKPAHELLDLKVADIAMGSGAFLVAACRYLALRLQEAWDALGEGEWTAFGRPRAEARDEPPVPADPLQRQQLAHRLVTERCLYGVDKNPMAVEMAKLSLWLITLAKDQPFSFVDHALRTGDSLLGVTALRQLRVAHLNPGFRRAQGTLGLEFGAINAAVDRALALRDEIEGFVVRDATDAARKADKLAEADAALEDARLVADLVVGAALTQRPEADALPEIGSDLGKLLNPDTREDARALARSALLRRAADWLVERRAAVGEVAEVVWADRDPFHWALEFPEVPRRGGFDAIVGNPPFQGGTMISGALGSGYREYLVARLARGKRAARADLVAYFYLRAASLIRLEGGIGLIATNTLAQGDTREIGLDRLVEDGLTIHRAISSEPWPGAAHLEMATVWACPNSWAGSRTLDRVDVLGITSSLSMRSRVEGTARPLAGPKRAFIGWKPAGQGFVLSPEEANALRAQDQRNADVVRPYLSGEDLNQRPDCSPSRWVIDFRDWPVERARDYPDAFARVEQLVYPERVKANREAHRKRWWQFGETRPALSAAIASLDRCIVLTLHSKSVQPSLVPTDVVCSHGTVVFSYDDDAHFGMLCSGFHWWWAVAHASTMRTDIRYTPTDCFETFVQPTLTDEIGRLGGELHAHRSALMLERQEGLTKTYNRVHDPDEHADDITKLREIHIALDYAVRDAYGWNDLDLGHDFHETKFGIRYTIAPVPRQEVLDRLLELNHQRYAEEVRQGLHGKAKPKRKPKATPQNAMTMDFGDG